MAARGWGPLALAALLAAGTLLLGVAVGQGWFAALDMGLASSLGLTRSGSPGWLITLMLAISWLGAGVQRLLLVALVAIPTRRPWGWPGVALLLLGSILANALSGLLKHGFARTRPAFVPHLDPIYNFAYPSGHATSAAATYLLAFLMMRGHAAWGWRAVALAMIFLTGLSRVMLGVHWPTDVLGGWMWGSAFALLGWWLLQRTAAPSSR